MWLSYLHGSGVSGQRADHITDPYRPRAVAAYDKDTFADPPLRCDKSHTDSVCVYYFRPDRFPVSCLRRQLILWLRMRPLSRSVIAICLTFRTLGHSRLCE